MHGRELNKTLELYQVTVQKGTEILFICYPPHLTVPAMTHTSVAGGNSHHTVIHTCRKSSYNEQGIQSTKICKQNPSKGIDSLWPSLHLGPKKKSPPLFKPLTETLFLHGWPFILDSKHIYIYILFHSLMDMLASREIPIRHQFTWCTRLLFTPFI